MGILTRNLFADAGIETNFRVNIRTIHEALTSFGWVQTADGGQLPLDYAGASANCSSNAGALANVFDGNTTTTWVANINPTPATPVVLGYDCGVGVTRVLSSYKIHFANTNVDEKDWTVQGSPDGYAWTTVDTRTGASAGGVAGLQTFTLPTPTSGLRYFKKVTTANQNTTTGLEIREWQLFDATPTTPVQFPTPTVRWNPLNINTSLGYLIYRMADALQTPASGVGMPAYLKIEFGTGASGIQFSLWVTAGTGTDGSGNLTGASPRSQLASNARDYMTPRKCIFSGDASRFSMAMFEESAAFIVLNVERGRSLSPNPDLTYPEQDRYVAVAGVSGTAQFLNVASKNGISPTTETQLPICAPLIASNANRTKDDATGLNVGIWDCRPFLAGQEAPLLNLFGYYPNQPISADSQIQSKVYGAARNFYALNSAVSATVRGATGLGFLMRYE